VSITATLIIQMIVFLILVGFTMKFVWPPIAAALDERARKVADGLSAADKARSELADANKRVEQQLGAARDEAAQRLGVQDGKWEAFDTHSTNPIVPSLKGGVDNGGAMIKLQWTP